MNPALFSWCETLIWVLAHSLWQGAALAAVLWLALRQVPARRAALRYGLAAGALAVLVVACFATWSLLRLEPAPAPTAAVASADAAVTATPPSTVPDRTETSRGGAPGGRAWAAWLAGFWLCGATIMLARSSAGLVQAYGLAARATAAGVDTGRLEEIVAELSRRLGIRCPALIVSERLRVPAVLGTLWPCVLIPAEMLSGVPVEQWRVILAHELAHIRRHDALVNLVQMLVESLLFFNPAVWWLSRQIRVEREACCDAAAAAACGAPLRVARTLVDVAAAVHDTDACRAVRGAVVLAMAEPGRDLTERVHRLIDPERAARPRVSWLGLGAVALGVLLAAAILQQGTDLAVRAAAELISPRERVEQLARLHAENAGVFLAPATSPPAGDAAAAGKAAAEEIEVTVVIRTEDGSPVPGELQLSSMSASGNSSRSNSLSTPRREVAEYRKAFRFPPSRLRLGASASGFAVAVSPIVSLFAGDAPRTIELVLQRGARAAVEASDEHGKPLAGAELKITARVSITGSSVGLDTRTFKANEQGVIALERIARDIEYDQELRAPGHQRTDRVGVLTEAGPMKWQMKAARPTQFRVVDAATGAAVAGARFELAEWRRPNFGSSHGDPRRRKEPSWLTYAQSDDAGRAVLDELRDGASYTFGVLAPGYGMALLKDIRGGQAERVIKLSPPLVISGRVVGPLDRLPEARRKGASERYLSYYTRLSDNLSDSGSATVDTEGKFRIDGLIAGERVTIHVPGTDQDFVMKTSREDVAMKIVEPVAAADFPKRDVVLRLVGTSPGAPARGTLYVDWRHPDPKCRASQNGPLPIQDDQVRMSIPIGAQLSFFPRNLAGYVVAPRDQVEVVAGAGPQVIEVPARPAGGIHGSVVRADGSPASSAFVTVFAGKLPPGEKDHSRINPNGSSASASFLVTLPLGGRYRVLAREQTDAHDVWTVSDEIALDENQPIAKIHLRLPEGKPLPIKVLDAKGAPVADQPVQLELSFSQPEGYSFSTQRGGRTGADGIARFERVSFDAPMAPLEANLYLTIPPGPFLGWRAPIDPRQAIEVRLQRGESAAGVLVEATTGKPIPDAEVRIMPRDFSAARFKANIRTRTNERGEFRFEGLEPLHYTGYIDGSVPKGTIIAREGGNTRFSYPDGVQPHTLRAGEHDVRWEVLLYPGSSLRAAD